MKYVDIEKSVVDFAYEIIEMQREIILLKRENEHLKGIKDDYFELLDSSKKHNDKMISNLLSTMLNK